MFMVRWLCDVSVQTALTGESTLSCFVVCCACSSEGHTFEERRSLWEFPTPLSEHIALA